MVLGHCPFTTLIDPQNRKISTLSTSSIVKWCKPIVRSRISESEDIMESITSMGRTSFPLSAFCTGLLRSLQAENATVTSLVCYAGGGKITHRFLLVAAKLNRSDKDEFWIRLDRYPRTRNPLRLFSSYQGAKDKVRCVARPVSG